MITEICGTCAYFDGDYCDCKFSENYAEIMSETETCENWEWEKERLK